MYRIIFAIFLLTGFLACNAPEDTNTAPAAEETNIQEESSFDLSRYPEALQKVFAQHGSLASWKNMRAMSYEIEKDAGNEKQMIDLWDRRECIEAATFKTGYDGKDYWLEADTSYKGNAVFYHNLIFYFYAMPFVLADDGIQYSEVDPVEYEGRSYPGVRISYNDGVGISPKDEYYIFYDPETYQMAWLGYTVTYFSGVQSDDLGWIRYNDWHTVNGMLLPKSLTWFKSEDGKLTEPRSTRNFVNITVSEEPFSDDVFAKTADAKVVE